MPFIYRQPDGSQIPIPSWDEFEALKASVEDLRGRVAAFEMANVSRNQRGPTAEELGHAPTGTFHAAPEMGQASSRGMGPMTPQEVAAAQQVTAVAGGLPQQIAAGSAGAPAQVHPITPPAIAQPLAPGQPGQPVR